MGVSKRMLCLAIAVAGMRAGLGMAADQATDWVKNGTTAEGDATVYLSTRFDHKSGKFAATPESVLDNRTSIEGTFLVGTYKYVSNKGTTTQGANGPRDELISTELIDCENGYAGTLHTVEKLHGKIVSDKVTPDSGVMMTQTHLVNADSMLCQLNKKKTPPTFNGAAVDNPNYNPAPTAADIDKLIDKDTSASGGRPL